MEEPRVWKDRRKTCTICDKKFRKAFVRRHHCRSCEEAVCNSCSTHREILPRKGYTQPVRICTRCFKKLTASKQSQAPKSDKRVTLEELKKHNTKDDAWIAIKGEVFDITDFHKLVPCGDQLAQHAGGIVDGAFDEVHGHGVEWIRKLIPYTSHMGVLEVSRKNRRRLSIKGGLNNAISVRHFSTLTANAPTATDSVEAADDNTKPDLNASKTQVKVYIKGKWRRGVYNESPGSSFTNSDDNIKYDVEVNTKPRNDSEMVVTQRVSVPREDIFWSNISLEDDVASSVKNCLQRIENIRQQTMEMNQKCDVDAADDARVGNSVEDPMILFSSWCKVHDARNVNWSINSGKLKRVVKSLYEKDDNTSHFMTLKANGVLSYSISTRRDNMLRASKRANDVHKAVLNGPQEYAVLTGQSTASVYSQGVVVLSLPENPPLERKIVFQVIEDDTHYKSDTKWVNELMRLASVQHYRSYVSMQYAASLLARPDTNGAVTDGVVAGAADSLRQLSTQTYNISTGNILQCSVLAPKLFADLRYRYFLRTRKADWLREKLQGSTAPLKELSKAEGYRLSEAQFIKSMGSLRKFADTGGGRSGADFLVSKDERFILKTTNKAETAVLYRLLPYYARHLELNPSSLIVPFLGVFYVDDTFVENSDLNDESAFTSAFQPVADDRGDEEESDNKQLKSRKVTATKYLCMANIFFNTDNGVRKYKKRQAAKESQKSPSGVSTESSEIEQVRKLGSAEGFARLRRMNDLGEWVALTESEKNDLKQTTPLQFFGPGCEHPLVTHHASDSEELKWYFIPHVGAAPRALGVLMSESVGAPSAAAAEGATALDTEATTDPMSTAESPLTDPNFTIENPLLDQESSLEKGESEALPVSEKIPVETVTDQKTEDEKENKSTRIYNVGDYVKRILDKSKEVNYTYIKRQVLQVFSYKLWEKSKAEIKTILENHHLKFTDKVSSSRQSPVSAEVERAPEKEVQKIQQQLPCLHQIFDLKGSTVARFVAPKTPAKSNATGETVVRVPVLKDQNFLDLYWPSQHQTESFSPSSSPNLKSFSSSNLKTARPPSEIGMDGGHGSRTSEENTTLAMSIDSGLLYLDEMDSGSGSGIGGLHLKPKLRERLIAQIAKDCKFLAQHELMDYSLLLGIHQVDDKKRFPEDEKTKLLLPLQSSTPSWLADNSRIREKLSKRKQQIFYIGIIDVLQEYNIVKQAERIAKKIALTVTGTLRQFKTRSNSEIDTNISSTNAPAYSARFLSFMAGRVFPKLETPRFQLPCENEEERLFLLNCLRHHEEVMNQIIGIEGERSRPDCLSKLDPVQCEKLFASLQPGVQFLTARDDSSLKSLKEACAWEYALTLEQVDEIIEWLSKSSETRTQEVVVS